MSKIQIAIDNDVKLLKLTRDEIALQAHLLKADMKDKWSDLEGEWENLQEHLGRAQVAAGTAGREVEAKSSAVIESLRDGYAHIKQALRS